ncbi:MAG: hypothetical protein IT176_03670 [Acidobacteria bacterium]|nr:hypothetical protein [Acidobacteriota bacterium]
MTIDSFVFSFSDNHEFGRKNQKDSSMRIDCPIAVFVALTSLFAAPMPATAQGERSEWVAGRLFWDADRTSNVDIPSGVGAGLLFGTDVARRFGVEVGFDWPKARTVTSIQTMRDPFFGPERIAEHVTHQSPTVTAGVLTNIVSASRASVSALTGAAFVWQRSRYDTIAERGAETFESVVEGTSLWRGLLIGIEAAIWTGEDIVVVPEVRAMWFGEQDGRSAAAIFRSGISVRWRY